MVPLKSAAVICLVYFTIFVNSDRKSICNTVLKKLDNMESPCQGTSVRNVSSRRMPAVLWTFTNCSWNILGLSYLAVIEFAFVGYEEFCSSPRVFSTEAEDSEKHFWHFPNCQLETEVFRDYLRNYSEQISASSKPYDYKARKWRISHQRNFWYWPWPHIIMACYQKSCSSLGLPTLKKLSRMIRERE